MRTLPSDPYRYGAANRDLEQEAVEWLVRRTSGDIAEHEVAAFAIWRADAENGAVYADAARFWQDMAPILERHDPDSGSAQSWRYRLPPQWLAAAAALILSIFIGDQYFRNWRHDYVSPSDRHHAVIRLADGTQVAMAPDTALDVRMDAGRRTVRLARGVAFFDVIHDARRPFYVDAGAGTVRVLGTAFSVERGNGAVDVIVARGGVSVTNGFASVVLTKDRAVRLDGSSVGPVHAVDAAAATLWTHGRLVLEGRPLSEVIDELNRHAGSRIVLMNGAAGKRRINALIDLDRIDGWLTALGTSQKLTVDRLGFVTLIR